jgi:hypothetical protein
MTTPFAMDRPSWAVMASAGPTFVEIGGHVTHWLSKGDWFYCSRCRATLTAAEFETNPECAE